MTGDPIAALERELVAAARRRAATGPVSAPVLLWPRARRRRIRVGDALSAAAASGAVIVALAALALLGGGGGGHLASTAAATPRAKLLATLAVLRRPQTAQDRAALTKSRAIDVLAGSTSSGVRISVASGRLAATAPWRSRVLVAVTAAGRLAIAADHTAVCCATRQQIEAGRAWLRIEARRSRTGDVPARFYLVVPDGVTRVLAVFDRGPKVSSIGASVTIHGNVAALSLKGLTGAPPQTITWFGAKDKHLRTFQFGRG